MSERIYRLITNLPETVEESIRLTKKALLGKSHLLQKFSPQNVIISGMGGSGISGEILANLGHKYSPIPLIASHDYSVPHLTGKNTLFFAVSYSGETEETISAYLKAKEKKALTCVLTSGGELKEKATDNGDLLITIPKGIPPRHAIGYLFTPLLVLLAQLEILPFPISAIKESARRLKLILPECRKVAKFLAKSFYQKIPYILAGSPLYSGIAYRWRCQLNENSKTVALFNTLPEVNHNEIEGIGRPGVLKNLLSITLLFDPTTEERNILRGKLLPTILAGQFSTFHQIEPCGENDLERILSLLLIGDLASFYLGRRYRKDIEKIERIEKLKSMMKRLTPDKKEV